jgi:hypothetical protein
MKKRSFSALAVAALLMSLLSGCETCKGMATGFSKDFKNTTHNLSGIDDWMKENLW